MYKVICFFIVVLFAFESLGQQKPGKYLVVFKDKANNNFSLEKPQEFLSARAIERRKKQKIAVTLRDVPPSKFYVDQLKTQGATVWYTSRWLNAALVLADSNTITKIKGLSFVKGLEFDGPLDLNSAGRLRRASKFESEEASADSINYGNGTSQSAMIGIQNLHKIGFKGQNMLIAVMDDGFNRIDRNSFLRHLQADKKVKDTYDFVLNKTDVYNVGGHGNIVVPTMASNENGKLVGTAPMANYAFYRSEDAGTERLIEEANYLFACERADSLGADIINTSLGYIDFDYSGYTHTYQDMNGDKILSTRVADWAAHAGILVVVSAGNSGNSRTYPYIGSPADADSVLSVGAVTPNRVKVGFSSIGPTADGRIKPEVSAQGSSVVSSRTLAFDSNGQTTFETSLVSTSGTSFSSPIIAGFAACFWQLNPQMTNMQVREAIMKMGSQAANPDNLLGFGIPQFGPMVILNDEAVNEIIKVSIGPNPVTNNLTIDFNTGPNPNTALTLQSINGLNFRIQLSQNQKQVIDLSHLPSGIYIGKLSQGVEIYNFKIIKY